MAPKYKLTYHDIKGLAESIRFMLSYMEADWQDNRLDQEGWAAIKAKTQWGKLPMLEVDCKQITQSVCILRYLGKQAGLAGKDDWENAQIDIMADTLTDLRLHISAFIREPNEEVKKGKKDTWVKETLPFYLTKFDATVKDNGGYLVSGKLSWADLLFASMTERFNFAADSADVTADYPHLLALKNRVLSLPQISQWIAKRPKTDR